MPNSKLAKAFLMDLITFDDVILYYQCVRENKRRGVLRSKQMFEFNLNDLSNNDAVKLFRFKKHEIRKLVSIFELSRVQWTRHRNKFSGVEGVCILLRRLSYPCRLWDLSKLFRRSPQSISNIFAWMVNYVLRHFGHLLSSVHQNWLSRPNIQSFADAIRNTGCPLNHVWGFIDGTSRPISRPVRQQRQYYSGHKRQHCMKFQSVLSPDGVIAFLDGPYIGRRHDSFILQLSKLLPKLDQSNNFQLADGTNFYLFGDTGYVNSKGLITNFRNVKPGSAENRFNTCMSEVRVAVEWGFRKVLSLFAMIDFKKNNRILLQPVGKWYKVAVLLCNCHTCLNGSQTSSYFGVRPPTLEEYLVKV